MQKNLESSESGSLLETHKGSDPRILFFYPVIFGLLAILAGGLFYQQLLNAGAHQDRERMQNQRRILVPGPRGSIYDRNGQLLVGSRPRFSVVLYLDELRSEFRRQFIEIRKAYRRGGDAQMPNSSQMEQIARATVVQRYLDQVNEILGRHEKVSVKDVQDHFEGQLLLPYTLVDGLEPTEYARLLERLPVQSPLQLYTSSARYYPYGSAAAHTLGYVGTDPDVSAEGFPGDDLTTFNMKGAIGRDGLEKTFDAQLEGKAGGTIFRVDHFGYKVTPPIARRLPVQGHSLTTSLDIDLQLAAEQKLHETNTPGAAVALDVRTGEVLVLASVPDYDLREFSPRLSFAAAADIKERQAWANRAISSAYPPGSTFKILTTIAALRSGSITPDQPIVDCEGVLHKFGRGFVCYNGRGHHGEVLLPDAIASSCDIFFYEAGWRTTPDRLAEEARRFHLGRPTGIQLPYETSRMVIPDPAWKQKHIGAAWYPGDTANMAIGQGYVLVTPLEMACFAASVARGEVFTKPTLLHDPHAPTQHTEPIGLTPEQRQALIAGMVGVTQPPHGTARVLTTLESLRVPGVEIAGKTGTAQIPGNKNVAWFICFAPAQNPEIAIAVAIEGDTAGEEFSGGIYSAPVASRILQTYFKKKAAGAATRTASPFTLR
ncbi:peptidoglycan glycosyltransferase [Horticoccus luteus]|uniref:Beta-lactamase n=1 Tax=Horticoccus luteus TaxID=2862869 RepID=A0A8F9TTH7_9BACT|nr:penicillin-binding transpeptidase domain-containing protein [Horticoccus luteus]QYM77493.1 peptidoglycan glycosyltransferase [Horticoccus luteus]